MTERGSDELPIESGVARQIDMFAQLQDSAAIHVGGRDRFFIHAGTNDLMRLTLGDTPEVVQSDIVTSLTSHVAALGARGAKTIIVASVQPVQVLPMLGGDDLTGLRGAIERFVDDTNDEIVASLSNLRPSLPEGANIVPIDQGASSSTFAVTMRSLAFLYSTFVPDAEAETLCAMTLKRRMRMCFRSNHHHAGNELFADHTAPPGVGSRDAGRMMDACPQRRTSVVGRLPPVRSRGARRRSFRGYRSCFHAL